VPNDASFNAGLLVGALIGATLGLALVGLLLFWHGLVFCVG
jgi:hypothetical protein